MAPEQLRHPGRSVDVRVERDHHDQAQLGPVAQRGEERVGDVVPPEVLVLDVDQPARPSDRLRVPPGDAPLATSREREVAAVPQVGVGPQQLHGLRPRLRRWWLLLRERARVDVEPTRPVGEPAQRTAAERRGVLPSLAEDRLDIVDGRALDRVPAGRARAGSPRTRRSSGWACGSPWWSASSRRLWARSMPPTNATSREGSSRCRMTTNFWWCEPPGRTRMSSSTSAPRRWSRSPRCRFSVAKKPVWSRCDRHTRPRTSTPRSSAEPSTSTTSEPGSPVSRSSASPCQSVKSTRSPARVAIRAS